MPKATTDFQYVHTASYQLAGMGMPPSMEAHFGQAERHHKPPPLGTYRVWEHGFAIRAAEDKACSRVFA